MEAGSLPIEGKGPLSSQRTPAEHDQRNGKSAQEDWLEPMRVFTLFSEASTQQPLGESIQNDSASQHHNPESIVRQPSVWQLNLGAFCLPFLDLMTADFQLNFRVQINTWIKGIHWGSQYITLAHSFKHKIYLGTATCYEFKELKLNISTQISSLPW